MYFASNIKRFFPLRIRHFGNATRAPVGRLEIDQQVVGSIEEVVIPEVDHAEDRNAFLSQASSTQIEVGRNPNALCSAPEREATYLCLVHSNSQESEHQMTFLNR
jgi:hypothetical protein